MRWRKGLATSIPRMLGWFLRARAGQRFPWLLRGTISAVVLLLLLAAGEIFSPVKILHPRSQRVLAQEPDPRSIYGSWGARFDTPVLMTHATLLPIYAGQVLFWDTNYNWDPNTDRIAHPYLWDFNTAPLLPTPSTRPDKIRPITCSAAGTHFCRAAVC